MSDDHDTIFNRRFLAAYAVFLSVAALAYIAAITFLAIPKGNEAFANTVLGFIMGTVLATPIAFYYGSSKSSQAKDQALVGQLPPPPPMPLPPDAAEPTTPKG